MSTQIAVRLPDEVVAFLDKAVPDSKATSRAALVSAAVEREMRRQAAKPTPRSWARWVQPMTWTPW